MFRVTSHRSATPAHITGHSTPQRLTIHQHQFNIQQLNVLQQRTASLNNNLQLMRQSDALIVKGEHVDNEHWWLVEYMNGQVGQTPVASMMVILEKTVVEEESNATKKGQANSTEETRIGRWIGLEGERRKSYSVAVIDGIKIKSRYL